MLCNGDRDAIADGCVGAIHTPGVAWCGRILRERGDYRTIDNAIAAIMFDNKTPCKRCLTLIQNEVMKNDYD
jgi:hypothetical protein